LPPTTHRFDPFYNHKAVEPSVRPYISFNAVAIVHFTAMGIVPGGGVDGRALKF
jgi:hypothetical protein